MGIHSISNHYHNKSIKAKQNSLFVFSFASLVAQHIPAPTQPLPLPVLTCLSPRIGGSEASLGWLTKDSEATFRLNFLELFRAESGELFKYASKVTLVKKVALIGDIRYRKAGYFEQREGLFYLQAAAKFAQGAAEISRKIL